MAPEKQIADSAFDNACRFVIKLGETAHGYGPTATRLEAYLKRIIEAFGLLRQLYGHTHRNHVCALEAG